MITTSRTVCGTSPRAGHAAISSSVKNGLPSARDSSTFTISRPGSTPSSPRASAVVSAGFNGASRSRSVCGRRASSATMPGHRVVAADLAGAVRADLQHRRVPQRPLQEHEQVPGRRVRPLQVLQHQHHRLPGTGDRLGDPAELGRPVRRPA